MAVGEGCAEARGAGKEQRHDGDYMDARELKEEDESTLVTDLRLSAVGSSINISGLWLTSQSTVSVWNPIDRRGNPADGSWLID